VHFKDSKGGHLKTIEANEGDDILSLAHEHDIDLEGALLSLYRLITPNPYPSLLLPFNYTNTGGSHEKYPFLRIQQAHAKAQ
jgi:hypothetical protein